MTHHKGQAFVTIITCHKQNTPGLHAALPMGLPTAPFTTQPGRASQLGSSQGHFHHIGFSNYFMLMWRTGLLKFCFKFCWAQRWKNTYFLMPVVLKKKKKRWLHFWLRDKQRGRECLGYSLLFWSRCSELPARDYFTEVDIPFYPLSTGRRNRSSMCWDLFFIWL